MFGRSSSSSSRAPESMPPSSSTGASSSGARDLMRSNSMLEPSIFPRRWMMPRMFGIDSGALNTNGAFGEDFFSDKLSKMNLFQDKGDEQIIRMKDDDAKFELSLDTHGFRPDEQIIRMKDDAVTAVDEFQMCILGDAVALLEDEDA